MSIKEFGEFEIYKSTDGEWRWRLKAGNGKVIATGGEGYSSKSACLNGIRSVRHYANIAEVEVLK